MRALITGLLVAFVALVTRGHAQQPAPRFWVAPFGTASLNNWPTPSHERLGVRVALPFLDRLTFYPRSRFLKPSSVCGCSHWEVAVPPPSGTWAAGSRRRDTTPGLISSPASSDPLDHSSRLLNFTSSGTSALLRSMYKWGSRSRSRSFPQSLKEPLPPNKRLKLTGGDRFRGNGVLCPWRGTDFVPRPCGGGRVARRLRACRRALR